MRDFFFFGLTTGSQSSKPTQPEVAPATAAEQALFPCPLPPPPIKTTNEVEAIYTPFVAIPSWFLCILIIAKNASVQVSTVGSL